MVVLLFLINKRRVPLHVLFRVLITIKIKLLVPFKNIPYFDWTNSIQPLDLEHNIHTISYRLTVTNQNLHGACDAFRSCWCPSVLGGTGAVFVTTATFLSEPFSFCWQLLVRCRLAAFLIHLPKERHSFNTTTSSKLYIYTNYTERASFRQQYSSFSKDRFPLCLKNSPFSFTIIFPHNDTYDQGPSFCFRT